MELSEASTQSIGTDAREAVKRFITTQQNLRDGVSRDAVEEIKLLENEVKAAFEDLIAYDLEKTPQMMSIVETLLRTIADNEMSSRLSLVAQQRLLDHFKQLLDL